MAKGDYGIGTDLTGFHIDVDANERGQVTHCSVLYQVVLASGRRHQTMFIVQLMPELKARLDDVAKQLALQVHEHEGLTDSASGMALREPLPAGWRYENAPKGLTKVLVEGIEQAGHAGAG